MKVVDIADEAYRELGSPTDLSIPAIAFWLRTNLGSLNNHINTSFAVNTTTYEVEQETTDTEGTSVTIEIAEEEKSILKKLYMLHYYDSKINRLFVNSGILKRGTKHDNISEKKFVQKLIREDKVITLD